MTKRFKTCILHIGSEKTGTSTLQQFLSVNRTALGKTDGIYYPVTTQTDRGSQWEFAAAILKHPWTMDIGQDCGIFSDAEQDAYRAAFRTDLEEQFSAHPKTDTLLISCEHFQSRVNTPAQVEALKAFLSPWTESFKILVYLRRQDELAISHFTTRVLSGYQGSDLDSPSSGTGHLFFDYERLYQRWADCFGEDAIIVKKFDQDLLQSHGLIESFCQICDIALLDKTKPEWLNQSVNARGLSFIQAIHRQMSRPHDPLDAARGAALIKRVSKLNHGRFYPLSRHDAQAFYTEFRDANERLRQRVFPASKAPLFSEDFSIYPETGQKLSAVYDDAVAIALQLWDQKDPTPPARSIKAQISQTINKVKPRT